MYRLSRLTPLLLACAMLAALAVVPWHAHDAGPSKTCPLCQVERAQEPEETGVHEGVPAPLDRGSASVVLPTAASPDLAPGLRGRAPPTVA